VTLLKGAFVRYESPYMHVRVRRTTEAPLAFLVGQEVQVRITESARITWFVQQRGSVSKWPELPELGSIPDGSFVSFEVDANDSPLVASTVSVTITRSLP
jgi:hypothetical protein